MIFNYNYLPSNFIEYNLLFIFTIIITIIALIIIALSLLLSENKNNLEKTTAYECGFDPFGDSRHTFDIKFYLVAILFIIFDLEVIYLFPWAVTLNNYYSFYTMIIFLIILTIGFLYEWRRGALDW